jgi:hypothetical protein
VTPGTYVERIPTFTAVQWDATQETADWIVGVFEGAAEYNDGDLYTRDSMDRLELLPLDYWVMKSDLTGVVTTVDPDAFVIRYQER